MDSGVLLSAYMQYNAIVFCDSILQYHWKRVNQNKGHRYLVSNNESCVTQVLDVGLGLGDDPVIYEFRIQYARH